MRTLKPPAAFGRDEPKLWTKCCNCDHYVRREPMWMFVTGPYYGGKGVTRYLCTSCAPDEAAAEQQINEYNNQSPPPPGPELPPTEPEMPPCRVIKDPSFSWLERLMGWAALPVIFFVLGLIVGRASSPH